jgi:L-ascorbate metabolism protein UlaG (beta-lactamase superfamily)
MDDGALADHRNDETTDRIAFLGHATVLIELDGLRLLTDPLLRGRVAHLRRQVPPARSELFAEPDVVLISHLHHDHLDLASLRIIGTGVPLIVPVGAGEWLRRRGFVTVKELGVGEVVKVGTLAVIAVQARHDGRRPGGPRAATLGYIVSGRHAVYFAGDTELFAEMADFPRALDVALLPVAGWGPTLGPGHMDPLDAARAAQLIEPRIAVPVHWGTLLPVGLTRHRARLGDPPRLFARHVASLAPSVEVRILSPGQGTEI